MIIVMLLNAFLAGVMLTSALANWVDGKSAKAPLVMAVINFAAIGFALISHA